MAERTGFEPATPGVTGRYSNQLNYRSAFSPGPSGCSAARIRSCEFYAFSGSCQTLSAKKVLHSGAPSFTAKAAITNPATARKSKQKNALNQSPNNLNENIPELSRRLDQHNAATRPRQPAAALSPASNSWPCFRPNGVRFYSASASARRQRRLMPPERRTLYAHLPAPGT